MKIVLHDFWRSSACYRVRIALNMAGLDFESRTVDLLAGCQSSEAYLRIHPQGLVPALEIDGIVLTQSLAIIEYLHEKGHCRVLPGGPEARARHRALAYAVAMEIHPVCNLRVAQHANRASGGAITMHEWMQKFIPLGLQAFEQVLTESGQARYCLGDTPGMADICLVAQIYNARRWKVSLDNYPSVMSVVHELEQLDAIARAHPDHFNPENRYG